jgi:signal transduction histidine kinase
MKYLRCDSLNKKLALLIMLAVLPALAILLYSDLEQRRQSVERAKQDVFQLTNTMAKGQEELARSTRQLLSTLSQLPQIQAMDVQASSEIFKEELAQNPNYYNFVLLDLTGEVLAAGRDFVGTNLSDRKHFREALARKDFAVGEYIVSRVGTSTPTLPFAYPVLDKEGRPKAVLATVINLASFSSFHDVHVLPEKSFVAVTDHRGIRLFYYPARKETNPVGKPIQANVWEKASNSQGPGVINGIGSDGLRRIFAFEPVRLAPADAPYLYVWAGIPEAHILAPANAALTRDLLLMLLATVMSLSISWVFGKNTLISPILSLVTLTRNIARGDLEVRSELTAKSDEFGILAKAFQDMAEALMAARTHLEKRVTERTLALEKSHAQLLHAEKLSAIGRLTASIAHEFNNPLYGIQSVVEGIKRNITLDETHRKLVDLALSECDRVKDLIKSLQDFNRPSSGVKEAVDIHALLDDMIIMVKNEYKSAQIIIKKQYALELPSVQIVSDQIKQVILNVLTNARDAVTDENGTVTITTENLGSRIAVRISDTGCGIAGNVLPHIFEPFFTTKPAIKGTGLGLSISYGIIKGHGGDMQVDSTPGRGTTFSILLPVNEGIHEQTSHIDS